MNFEDVRRKFGDILRESIPPKGLEQVFKEADRMGRVSNREVHRMIIALYTYLEEDEQKLPTEKTIQSA